MANIALLVWASWAPPCRAICKKAGINCSCTATAPVPAELVSGGAVVCANGTEVAQKADIIIIMVPDTPHVEAVLFAEDGVAKGISKARLSST